MEEKIIKFLKEHDTVCDYMSEGECIEYCKNEYPEDYKLLVAGLKGEKKGD